ncbi:hypothetical protein LUX34_01855 [Streptomyces werraensis]|nr:hypothetical protein [Streptomyces werraensis]
MLQAPGTRAVFAAHAVSTAGKLAAEVALSILVHQRTGSPLLSSLVLVCAFAPHAVGGTALSALADRFPPRRVLSGCDLLAAACVAAMLLPGLPVAALLLLLLGTGFVAPVTQGARTASLTQLPDDDLFPVGRSLLRTVSQTAVVTGFALGSVLVAAVGPYRMLAADAASLLVSAALVGLCTPAAPALAPDGRRSPAGRPRGLRRRPAAPVRRPQGPSARPADWAVPGFSAVGDGPAVAYTAQAGAPATAAGALFTGYAAGTVLGETAVARLSPARRRRLVVPLLVCSQAPPPRSSWDRPCRRGGAAGPLRGRLRLQPGNRPADPGGDRTRLPRTPVHRADQRDDDGAGRGDRTVRRGRHGGCTRAGHRGVGSGGDGCGGRAVPAGTGLRAARPRRPRMPGPSGVGVQPATVQVSPPARSAARSPLPCRSTAVSSWSAMRVS